LINIIVEKNNKVNMFKIARRNFFTIIPEYERGVKYNFGRFKSVFEPGIRLSVPIYHQIYTIDMRENIIEIPKQTLISKDNISFYVCASIQYKIIDAVKAINNVSNVYKNIQEKSVMELRTVLTSRNINEILQERNVISKELLSNMDDVMKDWGVDVKSVQLKTIEFEENMKKSLSVKAEADRNAEAKIINAKSDVETAKQYAEAAKIYAENPITMRLREYQLWQQVSKNPGSSIYVVPSNLLDFMKSGNGFHKKLN